MSYINPITYDPDELVGEDRVMMDGYDVAIQDVIYFLTDVNPAIFDLPDFMRTMYEEVQQDITDRLAAYVELKRIDLTCALMESNLELYGEE